ncbi:uncharacterized protein LOC110185734 [Drosophila serrata]|uniref:uncharacterized protein LOC110185734 n=1 Tax=Drosophila serrata TaxID=7274 RepID=UPI000A1D0AB8|nr:uncharacterized protein LOC110185734 [Drosophila serrata]KAH8393565.1 hypothetical protein KR200_004974 [Drosophila serrata]
MSFVPRHVLFFGLICSFFILQAFSDISLNDYGDPAYPGRCVLDLGSTVVLLNFGEIYRLKSLPCTNIFCTGSGYGMLYTCEKKSPPDGCRFTEYLKWDEAYPECCQRKVVCD